MAASLLILLVILLLGLLLLTIPAIVMYNRLVSTRNQCDEAWSNIDTELQRRYHLIPNLINTVKGYASHEADLLTQVTHLREKAFGNKGPISSQAQDESQLQSALGKLMVRLEAYPDLKSNSNFLELQTELANTENRIQAAQRLHNGNVRENNNRVQHFPSSIIASLGNFKLREYFELSDPAAQQPVDVQF